VLRGDVVGNKLVSTGPGAGRKRLNAAEINAPRRGLPGDEPLPCAQCILQASNPYRPRKIISAASRHYQNWQSEFYKRSEMAMNCTITTEDQDNIASAISG
jgi:hypothetical protein